MLHEQIGEIKKDFSMNLAEVRTSMIQFGIGEEELYNMSLPEADLPYSHHEDSKFDDNKSITSKASMSKCSSKNAQ